MTRLAAAAKQSDALAWALIQRFLAAPARGASPAHPNLPAHSQIPILPPCPHHHAQAAPDAPRTPTPLGSATPPGQHTCIRLFLSNCSATVVGQYVDALIASFHQHLPALSEEAVAALDAVPMGDLALAVERAAKRRARDEAAALRMEQSAAQGDDDDDDGEHKEGKEEEEDKPKPMEKEEEEAAKDEEEEEEEETPHEPAMIAALAAREAWIRSLQAHRRAVLDEIAALVRSHAVARGEAWVLKTLQLMALHAFFEAGPGLATCGVPVPYQPAPSAPHAALAMTKATAMPTTMHAIASERLLTALDGLASMAPCGYVPPAAPATAAAAAAAAEKKDEKEKDVKRADCPRHLLGTTADGSTWLTRVSAFIAALEAHLDRKPTSYLSRAVALREEDVTMRNKLSSGLVSQLGKLLQAASPSVTFDGAAMPRATAAAFHTLFQYLLLIQLTDPADTTDILEDLEQCFREFAHSLSAAAAAPARAEQPDIDPMSVLAEVLISLLQRGARSLRDVVRRVFRDLAPHLTREAVEAVMDAAFEEIQSSSSSDPTIKFIRSNHQAIRSNYQVPTIKFIRSNYQVHQIQSSSSSDPTIKFIRSNYQVHQIQSSSSSDPTIKFIRSNHQVHQIQLSSSSDPIIKFIRSNYQVHQIQLSSSSDPIIKFIRSNYQVHQIQSSSHQIQSSIDDAAYTKALDEDPEIAASYNRMLASVMRMQVARTKQSAAATAQRGIHFRLRVLDLLELYISEQPQSPVLLPVLGTLSSALARLGCLLLFFCSNSALAHLGEAELPRPQQTLLDRVAAMYGRLCKAKELPAPTEKSVDGQVAFITEAATVFHRLCGHIRHCTTSRAVSTLLPGLLYISRVLAAWRGPAPGPVEEHVPAAHEEVAEKKEKRRLAAEANERQRQVWLAQERAWDEEPASEAGLLMTPEDAANHTFGCLPLGALRRVYVRLFGTFFLRKHTIVPQGALEEVFKRVPLLGWLLSVSVWRLFGVCLASVWRLFGVCLAHKSSCVCVQHVLICVPGACASLLFEASMRTPAAYRSALAFTLLEPLLATRSHSDPTNARARLVFPLALQALQRILPAKPETAPAPLPPAAVALQSALIPRSLAVPVRVFCRLAGALVPAEPQGGPHPAFVELAGGVAVLRRVVVDLDAVSRDTHAQALGSVATEAVTVLQSALPEADRVAPAAQLTAEQKLAKKQAKRERRLQRKKIREEKLKEKKDHQAKRTPSKKPRLPLLEEAPRLPHPGKTSRQANCSDIMNVFALVALFGVTFAATCDNPVLLAFTQAQRSNFTVPTSPVTHADFPVCKNLNGYSTCCTTEMMHNITQSWVEWRNHTMDMFDFSKTHLKELETLMQQFGKNTTNITSAVNRVVNGVYEAHVAMLDHFGGLFCYMCDGNWQSYMDSNKTVMYSTSHN
ncbi:putative DNA polymerase phi [Paratrimastix pyriformis]|uniref:DNA polymerase phi n=1 Tax=Paratrimastix pyriformis TaxID=342808 RepID=A0ABQ8UJM9_9EUKA|nr:putative DNA polymerase phi [Paratrimastix pyriformis]